MFNQEKKTRYTARLVSGLEGFTEDEEIEVILNKTQERLYFSDDDKSTFLSISDIKTMTMSSEEVPSVGLAASRLGVAGAIAGGLLAMLAFVFLDELGLMETSMIAFFAGGLGAGLGFTLGFGIGLVIDDITLKTYARVEALELEFEALDGARGTITVCDCDNVSPGVVHALRSDIAKRLVDLHKVGSTS